MPRISAKLRLWLAAISFITAILLANVLPSSWVALWPEGFMLCCLTFLFLELGRVVCSRLGEYVSTVDLKLDNISGELDELRQSAVQLKYISALAARRH